MPMMGASRGPGGYGRPFGFARHFCLSRSLQRTRTIAPMATSTAWSCGTIVFLDSPYPTREQYLYHIPCDYFRYVALTDGESSVFSTQGLH